MMKYLKLMFKNILVMKNNLYLFDTKKSLENYEYANVIRK